MLLKVQRPLSGDLTHLLAYDEDRHHTTLIPVVCELGKSLLAAMGGEVVGYFQAQVGNLAGEGEEATFVPDPDGSILCIDATQAVTPVDWSSA